MVKGLSGSIEKPVLQWEIESLQEQGFKEIFITVSYMAEKIQDYFGDGLRFGVNIKYFVEEKPLGNAGALFKLRQSSGDDPFLLLNADAVFNVDFNRMVSYHSKQGAFVTLFTHPNSHPYDSGLIMTDEDKNVTAWLSKEDKRPKWYKNRVNAGIHILSPMVLDASKIDAKQIGEEK